MEYAHFEGEPSVVFRAAFEGGSYDEVPPFALSQVPLDAAGTLIPPLNLGATRRS